ncbi:hypothetical protein NEOLEDRAFT_792157 [Neolentinus lepideus HHB14362 ss-1]|uniref:Uncharacterized protein n=1 Tax=Neolentinus lepideus HHB14362 ss-1 TaxID=1314782 RepID=A0A165PKM6_9AGAM|nr:hypothetical protein NEOLEDRAFT_792157 [Neolentinus lepideus HHB14362 ss-1]
MIQTQMQTLQSIQDQQVQLLTSLAPILPLLQAIPAHIDAAKGDIKDVIRSISITPASPPGSTRLSGHPGRSQKKRSSSTLIAPEGHYVTPEGHYVALSESQSLSSSSPRKRPRAGDSSPTSPWRMDMNCSPSSDRSNRASSTRLRETYHSRSSLGPSSRRSTPQKTSSEAAHQSNIGHSSPIKSRDAQENLHQASDNIEVPRSNANILDLGRLAPSLPQEKPSQKSLRAVPRSSPAAPRRSSATSRSPPALHLADPEIVPESPCALPRLTDSALGTTPVIPFLQRVGSSSANTKLFGNLGSTVSYSVMKPSAVISSPGGALTPQINRRPTESRLIRSTPRRSGSLFSRGRPVLGQLNHPVPALGVSGRSKPKETGPSANFGTSPSSVAFSGLQASKRVSPEIPLSLKGCLASGPPGPPAGPPAWDLGTDERAVPVPTAPPSPTALFNSDDNVTLVSRAGNGQLTSVPLGNAQAMVSGKPMSLKDRKANETVVPNLKGKRFILVDDIDDEDDENSFGQW